MVQVGQEYMAGKLARGELKGRRNELCQALVLDAKKRPAASAAASPAGGDGAGEQRTSPKKAKKEEANVAAKCGDDAVLAKSKKDKQGVARVPGRARAAQERQVPQGQAFDAVPPSFFAEWGF